MQPSPRETILSTLFRNEKLGVFFADEIQKLYRLPSRVNDILIVDQLAIMGKASQHFAVAAGSSVNTASWACRPDKFGFTGYRTLNHSVFIESALAPIRDRVEFCEFAALYGRTKSEDVTEDAFLVFFF